MLTLKRMQDFSIVSFSNTNNLFDKKQNFSTVEYRNSQLVLSTFEMSI